jgi:two-component system, NtrC family, sensor kinase
LVFRHKLILLLLVVAVVPVALSGVLSIHTNQKEMISKIDDFQKKSISLAAQSIDEFLLSSVNMLKLSTQYIPFEQFPEQDLPDALMIPYRQFDFVNIVVLLDENGAQLAEPAFETEPKKNEALSGHESVTVEEVEEFGRHIPIKAALSGGQAFGPTYFCERTGTPRVALAISFPVQGGKSKWVMAVELSLRVVLSKVIGVAPEMGTAYMVDGQGAIVCHKDRSVMKRRVSAAEIDIVSQGLKGKKSLTSRYVGIDGHEVAGAFAPIESLGWGLALEQPVGEAFIAARRILTYTIFWVALSLVVALFGGIILARGVSRPLSQLALVSTAIANGDYDQKIPVRSSDEIGRLSESFNEMAATLKESFTAIQKRNREIREKNYEIESWNRELKMRVEQRTRDLKDAHNQISQSQKLAAVAELGAGVAHEVNNPLTGIQGFAELMMDMVEPDETIHEMLGTILSESRKIKAIIDDLRRFSFSPDGVERVAVDINDTILQAFRLVQVQIADRKIVIKKKFEQELPAVLGDSSALQQVFIHLLTNAMNSMSEGGKIFLLTSQIEGGALKVSIIDNGRGIPKENISKIFDPFFTTKDEWSGKGLGLSVAHKIVEEHNGTMGVKSVVGKGTLFTIILPSVPRKLHLR